jgi:hypothetical protein
LIAELTKMPSRINVVKCLLSGAIFCTVLVSRAPAQQLAWIEPSLIGVPAARCCASAVYDTAMGATLLFGGWNYATATVFGDTWEFSKATGWKQLAPSVSPPPLWGMGMAYDPTTETVVIFGGTLNNASPGTTSNETWTWDGVTWTQQFPPVSPPAFGSNVNQMVFDSLIGKVVLFGAGSAGNDTWEWEGTSKTWTQKFPANSPSARGSTPLAYDETSKQVILFGGASTGYIYWGDTWTYNGVDWVQQQPATLPPPRCDEGLAFDPILHGVVMFGGLAGPCEDCGDPRLNDTWVWTGKNWIQVQTSANPSARSGATFNYDATAGGMLLFGGWIGPSSFTSTTWLFGLL